MDDLDHNVMAAEHHSGYSVKLVQYCETILPKLSDQIVTCTYCLKQIYVNMGFNEEKITWLPNGVKLSDFNTQPGELLKEKFGLKSKVIVYLGSLNNQAQLYPLIKAMELIIKEETDVSLMIIGDGMAKEFFEELTRNLQLTDCIKFVGRIPYNQVSSYLSMADIAFACFPSPLTGASGALKVFIYMAAGLPVVVNPAGDLPYYIDNGKAGAISTLDAPSLSNALLKLLKDDKERRSKGCYARNYVQRNFDWVVLTKKLVSVYKNVLDQN